MREFCFEEIDNDVLLDIPDYSERFAFTRKYISEGMVKVGLSYEEGKEQIVGSKEQGARSRE